ncbi:nuclear transport factor 2 family protein [Paraburkholderia sp. SIMBA_049]
MASPSDTLSLMSLDATYWACADCRNAIDAETLFIEDGILQLGSMALKGRQAIRDFFAARNEENVRSKRHTRHVVSGLDVSVHDAEHATLDSVVAVFAGHGELPIASDVPSTIADVNDVCVRGPEGEWLFERRIIRPVFVGPAAAKFAR